MVSVPQWISKDFLELILKQYLSDENIKILEYTTSAAIPVGENYTSDLLRICINYTTSNNGIRNSFSLIAKNCPDNEMLLNYAREMKLFDQEIEVYTKVFPAIQKLYANNPEDLETLSAKCFHFIKEPLPSLILEDLTVSDFRMHPREQGLDLQHCLLAVEKFAYFHAATAALHRKEPSLIDKYNLGIFWENNFSVRWIKTGFKALIEASSTWPDYEKYSNKLKVIQNEVVQRSFASMKRKPEDLNVLNHGDAWINNFMFLYDSDGTPNDFRFVDFQTPFFSSPALDFNFFWATSPNIEVRRNNFGDIFNCYLAKFSRTFSKLEYPKEKIPNKKLFLQEFNSRAFFGLTAAVTVLPLVAATKRDDATFDDLFAENQNKNGFRYHAYNNQRYRKYLEYLLPFYDALGILD